MIDPQHQWCAQIDVTNACRRSCSNCTHLVSHASRWYMTVECFADCAASLAAFPTESPASKSSPCKLVGIIGGEPLLHPKFQVLVQVLKRFIPYAHRGLWTGEDWERSKYAILIREAFPEYGVHCNRHDTKCLHTPVLVAVDDIVSDPADRVKLINDCWLQQMWSSSFTPKGYFFCEVAACMDLVFKGSGGLPIETGCWRRPLADFKSQIETWCHCCGVSLNLKGRLASEGIDDISQSNLADLQDSPQIKAGRYRLFAPAEAKKTDKPWEYNQ